VNAFALLAALLVLTHVAFAIFAVTGGLLALRWPRVAWVHLPAAAWAAYIELSGGICPLTPLENEWRVRAGLNAYSGDFVARYVFPALYPEGLTFAAQVALGLLVVAINVTVYVSVFKTHRKRQIRRRSMRVEQ
jgi:hypothetical protein